MKETGIVKWFSDSKGYGFITRDGRDTDVFVHYSQIVSSDRHKTLVEDDRVEFEMGQGPKGACAEQVRRV